MPQISTRSTLAKIVAGTPSAADEDTEIEIVGTYYIPSGVSYLEEPENERAESEVIYVLGTDGARCRTVTDAEVDRIDWGRADEILFDSTLS